MMIRSLVLSLALGTAFAVVQAMPSYAQTTETDQSEEDWRNSRKKRSTTPDIFDPNVNGIGQGLPDIKPLTPIEQLPRDSQRHLKKLRAEIIAESDPGQAPDTSYKPSEAAQNDPDLAAQEEEAWKIIVTDLELGGGQGGQPQQGQSQDGEKVAVVGRGSNPSGQNSGGFGGGGSGGGNGVIRGGSSSSVADILSQIKGIKAGRGVGTGTGTGTGSGGGNSPTGSPIGSPTGTGTGTSGTGAGSGSGSGTQEASTQGSGGSGQSPFGQSQFGQSPLGQGTQGSGQSPLGQGTQQGSGQSPLGQGTQGSGQSPLGQGNQGSGQSPLGQGSQGSGSSGSFPFCLLYTSPSPRDGLLSRMPSSA